MGKYLLHSSSSAASVTSSVGPHSLALIGEGTGLNKSQTQKEGKATERSFPCSCCRVSSSYVSRSYKRIISVFPSRETDIKARLLAWVAAGECVLKGPALAACPRAHHSLFSGALRLAASELCCGSLSIVPPWVFHASLPLSPSGF